MCTFFQLGKGVEANQQLSLELYRRAAELGDPEAQGQMGVRHAFGLQHAQSVDGAAIREFGQVGLVRSRSAELLDECL